MAKLNTGNGNNNTGNGNNNDGKGKGTKWIFCKQYINRWGKLMIATDYGHQFWRFPVKG